MAKAQHAPRYRPVPPILRRMRQEAALTQRGLAERRADVAEFLDWCRACGADPDQAFRPLRRQRGVWTRGRRPAPRSRPSGQAPVQSARVRAGPPARGREGPAKPVLVSLMGPSQGHAGDPRRNQFELHARVTPEPRT